MASAAGWSTFVFDVQQLLGVSSVDHSLHFHPQSHMLTQSSLPRVQQCQQLVSSPTSPALLLPSEPQWRFEVSDIHVLLHALFDILIFQQHQTLLDSHFRASSSLSNPLPDVRHWVPQLHQAPSAPDTINRAFQLRNDSDLLVCCRTNAPADVSSSR